MAASTLIDPRPTPRGAGTDAARSASPGVPEPRRALAHPVVALLDGGPDDAEVVDVALAVCVHRASDLRVILLFGAPDAVPTPLADAYALAYVCGAMAVARLVPGVYVSATCLARPADANLRRELEPAELLVASADAAREVHDVVPGAGDGGGCPVMSVHRAEVGPDRLRLGYRLALLRELEGGQHRADGSTTPEELDDAWHVGVAHPPLAAETINAWATCATWPPRAGPEL